LTGAEIESKLVLLFCGYYLSYFNYTITQDQGKLMELRNKEQLFSLKETADRLGVDGQTLILWNENNILKPTITLEGVVGYKEEQIKQFVEIQNLLNNGQVPHPAIVQRKQKHFSGIVLTAFGISFLGTIIGLNIIFKPQAETAKIPEVASADRSVENYLTANNITYSETASYPPAKGNSNSVFDDGGNIKGTTANKSVLAANNFYDGIIQNTSQVSQPNDLNLLLIILAFGTLSIPLILKKHPAYAPVNTAVGAEIKATDLPTTVAEQRILEVNQKTDGTVVLSFQGQEYKVSKPELDSESDQFIERLMGLVGNGTKEIDYDAGLDQEIKLSAPLSKIVTRLGFVGLKRDLFFPRTSKNRVLFRRYLTQNDLAGMNLSPELIKRDFAA
jgi:hypothetical protein